MKLIKPMKANPLTDKKWSSIMAPDMYIAQEKLEGNRSILYLPEKKFISSGGHDITSKLTHLLDFYWPNGQAYAIDGEIWMPGKTDAEIAGMLNPNSDYIGEEMKGLNFYMFDIMTAGNVDLTGMPLKDRLKTLTALHREMNSKMILTDIMFGNEEEKLKWFDEILARGGEGLMFKNLWSTYQEGKRPANTWYKLKGVETFDVIITGFTEGKGKYEGQIGAFQYSMFGLDKKLYYLGNCSGMDDMTRELMTKHPDRWSGQVVEIAGLRQLESGAIKNPRYKRVRWDKQPYECIWIPTGSDLVSSGQCPGTLSDSDS